jgi:DNA-binding NtrC family response regulator
MPQDDAVSQVLAGLGHTPGDDSLRTLDDLLRREPRQARALAAALAPRLARLTKEEAGRATLALGSVHLVLGDLTLARELLAEAASLVSADDASGAARAALRLASLELAAGRTSAAKLQASRAFSGVVALGDAELLSELARVLEQTGETLAAEALEHLRRRSPGRADRGPVLARLVAMLNSCSAGTSEPLFEVLRAVVEETRAARGFLMLYEGSTLRFELGLSRASRRLGADDFACSTTVVDRALETGRPVLVPDLAAQLPFALATSARSLGIRSALCAPLRVERRRGGAAAASGRALENVKGIAGVLYVDSAATGSFEDEDARFFEALADAAVLALRAAGGKPARPVVAPERAPAAPRVFGGIGSRAPAMHRALDLLERVAATDASVVLRGESGTGKELFARALHAQGRRAQGPFVPVDCAALSDGLALHELFGHEEGAFTGAGPARAGLIERANGGTFFLDAVDEMPPAMQGALLRVLQEGEVRRMGGEQVRPASLRLVAATQRDLGALVERGLFRQDLLFRLAVVEIRIPPLRERREDLGDLARQILDRLAASGETKRLVVEPGALERLEAHGWPGNVRELENVLRAAALGARDESIDVLDVESALGFGEPASPPPPPLPVAPPARREGGATPALDGTMEQIESLVIRERLERFGWNQVRAAESLGVDRTTLRRKITRYGIVRGRE